MIILNVLAYVLKFIIGLVILCIKTLYYIYKECKEEWLLIVALLLTVVIGLYAANFIGIMAGCHGGLLG